MRAGDQHKLGYVTPYGMYCYTVMGQGLTGGTHTYSRFRNLVFGNIPEGIAENGERIPGFLSVIGDHGDIAFDGLIDDSYGSAETFEKLFAFLHTSFFPRCEWGPMYLKGPKCNFFECTLGFVGLEAGENGIRPSLRKRRMISEWPTPMSWDDVRAFCYLTPFLRRFIPGRAELVSIMKTGMEQEVVEENKESGEGENLERKKPGRKEVEEKKRGKNAKAKKPRKVEGPFRWTSEQDSAFQAIKRAISDNAMAPPDPELQYHLAVDASKKGIGGVLFQMDKIAAHTEASNSLAHREAEKMIMFISFRLEDAETRYSNSEREALAVIRCLAEVRWMIIASEYPTLVYTDHEALKVLLTGMDNDAHGRIAKWQERLGEYYFRLIHRASATHFMGNADGLSRLPMRLMHLPFAKDSVSIRPAPITVATEQHGIILGASVSAQQAVNLRNEKRYWGRRGRIVEDEEDEGKDIGKGRQVEREGEEARVVAIVGEEPRSRGSRQVGLEMAAREMKRRKWKRWLGSGFYVGRLDV